MRRRGIGSETGAWRGGIIVLGLIALVAIVAGVPYIIASDDAQRPELDEQRIELQLPDGTSLDSLATAEVLEVIDGDTIDVELDGTRERVRYFGVDTPERGESCFREATDRNTTLLEGDEVLLLKDARLTDTVGRLLRYVFLPDGTSLDATLVAEGFGVAWDVDGRYKDRILGLQQEAQDAGRGCLW